jgi:exosortase D (VPLPA-CTERM-specific)
MDKSTPASGNQSTPPGFLNTWWVPGLLLIACLTAVYWPILDGLVKQWMNNQDYSHGLVILPVTLYLVWQKRDEIQTGGYAPDWRALILLVFASAVYVLGELGAELFTTRLSMLIFVVGFVWLFFGLGVVRVLRFPLGFMFLMLPLPGFIYRNVTFPLQLISSRWSVELLQNLGIAAYREGNVIDLDFMVLQVVEACNGLRYILPLFSLGVLFSYFLQKRIWKRVVLVLATIPISVAANIFRIAGTGITATYMGEETARGFFHDFSGWLVFVFCLGLFALFNWSLRFIPDGPGNVQPVANKSPGPRSNPRRRWALAAAGAAIVLTTPALVGSLGEVPPIPIAKTLDGFPLDFHGYSGIRQNMDPDMWEQVGAQEYIIINYAQPALPPVNFYVAYYEYQRKGGDFVHSPRLCLPGAGWAIEKNRVRRLEPVQADQGIGDPLKLNELVISKGGSRQLVYFWYQGRGRNFTNEFVAKFYMVWDGLFRRRTDGALVRVVMPLSKDQSVEAARRIADPFALAASAALQDYLP